MLGKKYANTAKMVMPNVRRHETKGQATFSLHDCVFLDYLALDLCENCVKSIGVLEPNKQ